METTLGSQKVCKTDQKTVLTKAHGTGRGNPTGNGGLLHCPYSKLPGGQTDTATQRASGESVSQRKMTGREPAVREAPASPGGRSVRQEWKSNSGGLETD